MPNTSSAKKALRQSQTHAIANLKLKVGLKRALKSVSTESLSATVSLIDKAAKHHLLHPNRAARLKSQLAHRVGIATAKRPSAQAPAKATKKSASKK